MATGTQPTRRLIMKYTVPLGRLLYSLIFIMASINHFSSDTIAYATGQGVPLAGIAVPLSGVMAFVGGLSIAAGYQAKWGALLLILFLVPVTFMMHAFWTIEDPMAHQMQMVMFLKNLSMLGGAILIAHFGPGPFSLDERKS